MRQTRSGGIPLEIEAKLLVPTRGTLRALARLTHVGRYPLRARGAARLQSMYLDTPELTLARQGVALRLRRHGRRWECTVKWGGRVEGDLHERPEWTVALPRAPVMPFVPPAGPLSAKLAALVAGRPLAPILVTDIRRRLFDVMPPAPRPGARPTPIAELALDHVRLCGPQRGGAEDTYYELEIEQRHGRRRQITGLAQRLRREFHLAPSSESKFARGLTLLYGPKAAGRDDRARPARKG